MSGRLKMKSARLAVGFTKADYRLASDLPAWCSGLGRVVMALPHLSALVTLLEDLDFSFKCLRLEKHK